MAGTGEVGLGYRLTEYRHPMSGAMQQYVRHNNCHIETHRPYMHDGNGN